MKKMIVHATLAASVALLMGLLVPTAANAHCDTLDGPVVVAAKAALDKGDVTPVLKWVRRESETEIRAAFQKTLTVRGKGPEAKELADMYFYETLVRIHREGEKAPYTGVKPAGQDPGPALTGADKALESGSVDALVKLITEDVAAGVRTRFAKAADARKHADQSTIAGREYVEAYVNFIHYVERIHQVASSDEHHSASEDAAPAEHKD